MKHVYIVKLIYCVSCSAVRVSDEKILWRFILMYSSSEPGPSTSAAAAANVALHISYSACVFFLECREDKAKVHGESRGSDFTTIPFFVVAVP